MAGPVRGGGAGGAPAAAGEVRHSLVGHRVHVLCIVYIIIKYYTVIQ